MGVRGLSFGSAEQLKELLGVQPGAVTPYSLINTKQDHIQFLLDQDLLLHDIVNFHPLRNDMTTSVTIKDFINFFTVIGHKPKIMKLPLKEQPDTVTHQQRKES